MPYPGLLHPEPFPCSSPLLTHTSTGHTQTQFCLSLSGVSGSWCAQGMFESSERLQDGWVMVENSDKTWSPGEGNGKPLHYSCLEDPMNSMKRVRIKYAKFRILCSECLGIYLLASSLRRGATLWDNCHLLLLHKLKGYLFPS